MTPDHGEMSLIGVAMLASAIGLVILAFFMRVP